MNVVLINRTILSNKNKNLIIGPGHTDQSATWVFPNGFGDLDSGGVEDSELSESRFGVELDNLGIVANDGDWAAEGGTGDLVAAEIDVFPLHWVDFGLTVVPVVEELPFGGDRDCCHWRIFRAWKKKILGSWIHQIRVLIWFSENIGTVIMRMWILLLLRRI